MTGISRERLERARDEADRELDSLVEVGEYERQALYWLGRKRMANELLEECE